MIHLDELRKDMADSPELAAHLRQRAGHLDPVAVYERSVRVPFGLVGAPAALGETVTLRPIRPQVPFRAEHMVLSPDSAHNFELTSFKSQSRAQYLDSEPLPLDTFSIEYLKNDRLSEMQGWKSVDTCGPGMAIQLEVRRIGRKGKRAFRGILWGVAGIGGPSQPHYPPGFAYPGGPSRPPFAPLRPGGARGWCPQCMTSACFNPNHH